MLTQLLPDQVAKFWDIIKYAIEESLPPTVGESPDKMNNILESILIGKTQCWVSYERTDEGVRFEGVMLTKILYDDASKTRSLLIYCLYGYEPVDRESWKTGFVSLLKFAKSKRCRKISGYTNVAALVRLGKSFGADIYSYVSIDVNKTVKLFDNLE